MTEKNFKKELEELKQVDALHKYVVESIVENATDNYTNHEGFIKQVTARVEDVQHGCSTGIVSELIYYSDTVAFYEKYKTEINSLLYEMLEDTGCSIQELFGDRFEKDDPLCIETNNQNLLAWFGYEEINNKIANILEI
jgi:hypothetical protein